MRVVLVGSPSDRARLRAGLNGSIDVVAEFASLAAAQRADIDADAVMMADTRERLPSSPGPPARDELDDDDARFEEPLTPREIQVLELLAEGLPNKAIADRLHISDQTVKFHVSSISGKLGAANRTDAVRRAVRRGLITL
jgi:NarL family two-component system response regulator YdfI